jgi:uncharacterized protein
LHIKQYHSGARKEYARELREMDVVMPFHRFDVIGENGCDMVRTIDKEQVIATLKAHEQELKEAGIVRVRLFGSVARGDAGEASDVDLLAEFDKTKPISLISLVRLENRLSDLLGCKVDLAQEGALRARIRANVEREAAVVF